jgi:RimJ/RimL family protein N-acetyltransferase
MEKRTNAASVSIRRVEPEEWRELRALRLEALLDTPDAFGSSYQEELGMPDEAWRWWISGEGGTQPGVATTFVADDDGFQGMATGALFDAEPGKAHLFGMWVRPSERGRGLGEEPVEAVVSWTRRSGAREIELRVTEGNSPARRLYERTGFAPTGERTPLRDGSDLACAVMIRTLG